MRLERGQVALDPDSELRRFTVRLFTLLVGKPSVFVLPAGVRYMKRGCEREWGGEGGEETVRWLRVRAYDRNGRGGGGGGGGGSK